MRQLLGNFAPQVPHWGFAPGPHWGTSIAILPTLDPLAKIYQIQHWCPQYFPHIYANAYNDSIGYQLNSIQSCYDHAQHFRNHSPYFNNHATFYTNSCRQYEGTRKVQQ